MAQPGMTTTPTGPLTECGMRIMAFDADCGMMCFSKAPETPAPVVAKLKAREKETLVCQSPNYPLRINLLDMKFSQHQKRLGVAQIARNPDAQPPILPITLSLIVQLINEGRRKVLEQVNPRPLRNIHTAPWLMFRTRFSTLEDMI